MKRNVGKTDKIIRIVIAAALVALFLTNVVSGTPGIIALAVAGISLFTAFANFCGLYRLVGISTCKIVKTKN
jgi:hypothetical protein